MSPILYGPDNRPIRAARVEGVGPVARPKEPLTRRGIEKVRIRVTLACTISAVEAGIRTPKVRHLWFPEDNVNKYMLRDGNPPPDVDRPKHLRGHRLAIDVGVIPKDVWDEVKQQRKKAKRMVSEPTRMNDITDKELGIMMAILRAADKRDLPEA